jgi:hypothetical protein
MPKKMLFFIVGATAHGSIETLQFVKPGVSDAERAQALLDKARAKTPNRRLELFAIAAADAPGFQALGDKMDDDEIVEDDFEA